MIDLLRRLPAAACVAALSQVALAQEPAMQNVALNIDARMLARGLIQLTEQSGMQLIYPAGNRVVDIPSKPLSGNYTPQAALEQLLQGTGLKYEFLDAHTIAITDTSTRKPAAAPAKKDAPSQPKSEASPGVPTTDAGAGIRSSIFRVAQSEGQAASDASAGADQSADRKDELRTLEEVTVTATRRSTGAQSTPISLTAISGDDLKKQGTTNMEQLSQLTPNLYVNTGLASGSPRFSLRGISTRDVTYFSASPVAIYTDDVYQASLIGTATQLFDLQRIEVLRGPQGTLFGKNTTGGAITYFSQTPTNREEGYLTVRVAGGNQSERSAEGALNLPLIDDKLALRVSFRTEDLSNYVKDEYLFRGYGASNSRAGRAQLQWTPSDTTTVSLLVSGTNNHGQRPVLHVSYLSPCTNRQTAPYLCNGGTPKPSPPVNADTIALSDVDQPEDFNNDNIVLRINQAFEGLDLTSITNYARGKYYAVQDTDGAPGDFLNTYGLLKHQQIGQELRLATDARKRLSGLVGLYFMNDKVFGRSAFAATENGPPLDYDQTDLSEVRTRTYAAFASLTFKLTEQLSLSGGLRKSNERRTHEGVANYFFPFSSYFDWQQYNVLPFGTPPVPPDATIVYDEVEKSAPVTWDASLNYRPSENLMIYSRIAKGFRSGGFNSPTLLQPVLADPYGPETLQSYEVGFKSDFLERTLRVNAAVFHYTFHDQQVSSNVGGTVFTNNAGASKVDGGELEINALPTRNLELGGSLAYARAVFTDYDSGLVSFKGHYLTQAPKVTANATAAYTFDLSESHALRASTIWSYRTRIYSDPANTPEVSSGPLTTGNVRLELQPASGKGLSVAAFANNVTNRKDWRGGFYFAPAFFVGGYIRGILYGADLRYQW